MALVRVGEVSRTPDTKAPSSGDVLKLYETRARAELTTADAIHPGADTVSWRGAAVAQVAVVKGLPGPTEAAGGEALSGPDGTAITKALEALGWAAAGLFFTLSRPVAGIDNESAAKRLRLQIEAVDPYLVIALDRQAADDLARAYDVEPIVAGTSITALGRILMGVSEFEQSLADSSSKQHAWAQLQLAKPPGPVY